MKRILLFFLLVISVHAQSQKTVTPNWVKSVAQDTATVLRAEIALKLDITDTTNIRTFSDLKYVDKPTLTDSLNLIRAGIGKVYITPEQYGAIGDSLTDDTESLATFFGELSSENIGIIDKKYRITSPIYFPMEDGITLIGGGGTIYSDVADYAIQIPWSTTNLETLSGQISRGADWFLASNPSLYSANQYIQILTNQFWIGSEYEIRESNIVRKISGDTVFVDRPFHLDIDADTYTVTTREQSVIEGLTIRGLNLVILDELGRGFTLGNVVQLNVSDCKITAPTQAVVGLLVHSFYNAVIKNNTISNFSNYSTGIGYGIVLGGGSNALIENNYVTNCHHDITVNGEGTGGLTYGVKIMGNHVFGYKDKLNSSCIDSHDGVFDSEISGNDITCQTNNGIMVRSYKNFTIRDNFIKSTEDSSGASGIQLQSDSEKKLDNFIVSGNRIYNMPYGILTRTILTNSIISDNVIRKSFVGISADSTMDYSIINNNIIDSSTIYSIRFYGGVTNSSIINNRLTNNADNVLFLEDSRNNIISNSFQNSAVAYTNRGVLDDTRFYNNVFDNITEKYVNLGTMVNTEMINDMSLSAGAYTTPYISIDEDGLADISKATVLLYYSETVADTITAFTDGMPGQRATIICTSSIPLVFKQGNSLYLDYGEPYLSTHIYQTITFVCRYLNGVPTWYQESQSSPSDRVRLGTTFYRNASIYNTSGDIDIQTNGGSFYIGKYSDDSILFSIADATGQAQFKILSPPATPTSTGTAGQVIFGTDGAIYICYATNQWSKNGATSW